MLNFPIILSFNGVADINYTTTATKDNPLYILINICTHIRGVILSTTGCFNI